MGRKARGTQGHAEEESAARADDLRDEDGELVEPVRIVLTRAVSP